MVCLPIPPLRRSVRGLTVNRPPPATTLLFFWRSRSCGRRSWCGRCCRGRRRCLLLRRRCRLRRSCTCRRFGTLTNNRRTTGRRNQDRERERCDHKEDRGCCRRSAQYPTGAAGSKRGLTATTTESSSPVCSFTLLKKHNKDQENTNDDVKDSQQRDHKYLTMAAKEAGSKLAPPTSAPS